MARRAGSSADCVSGLDDVLGSGCASGFDPKSDPDGVSGSDCASGNLVRVLVAVSIKKGTDRISRLTKDQHKPIDHKLKTKTTSNDLPIAEIILIIAVPKQPLRFHPHENNERQLCEHCRILRRKGNLCPRIFG